MTSPQVQTGSGNRHRRSRNRAFSTIELIGVLAVLLILALAVSPSVLRQVEWQMRERESGALTEILGGLREHILSTRQVPAPATIPAAVGTVLGWPASMVATNAAGLTRVFLYDPALQLGSTTAANLPFTQGVQGVTNLAGARILVASSLGSGLPAVIADPGTNATVVFNALWDAPDGTEPAGWTWGGQWADILVRRLNLEPLFTQVVLNNNSRQMGRYSIDNTNAPVVLPAPIYSAHYLSRTVLGLHGHDGTLQVLQVVPDAASSTNSPVYQWFPSYVYDQEIWRGRLFMTPPPPRRTGQDLQAAYEIFMSGPPNVYKVGGVTQSSVTSSMWVFMSNYVAWANGGFTSTSLRNAVQSSQSSMASQLTTYCNKKATVP
ncbi:MAG: hypothetical protein IPM17_00915 [Verrucomicrobia bacterium]|nr:hypothetical protein [Verrucomicrobiota bacterium]